MAALNIVTLFGRLTRDAEVRKSGNGVSYCRITVACDRFSKDKDNKEADFVPVIAWKQSADYLGTYGRKGNQILVNGSIRTGSYQNKDGSTVYTTEVWADRVQLIGDGKKQQNDYPTGGNPLKKNDIDANDGFDTGSPMIDDGDLPF